MQQALHQSSFNVIICSTYSCNQLLELLTFAPMTGYSDHIVHDHHSERWDPCVGANHGKKELWPLADGEREKVCSELCQSINVRVEHPAVCYSFKYECWETGRWSDRQAVGW